MSTSVVIPPAAAARVAVAKPFPLGAPRLIDVHVSIDQARQDDPISHVLDRGTRPGHRPASTTSTIVSPAITHRRRADARRT